MSATPATPAMHTHTTYSDYHSQGSNSFMEPIPTQYLLCLGGKRKNDEGKSWA